MFYEVDTGVVQEAHTKIRLGLTPVLIDVHPSARARAECPFDRGDMPDIVAHGALPDLELEDVVAPVG